MAATFLYNFSSPPLCLNKIKHFSKPGVCANHPAYRLKLLRQQKCKNGCVALGSGSVAELEKQPEAEFMNPEEEEWLIMGNSRDKCKERKGMVELLECLESEAIMGDDEGKEPSDYNRRARIFDKSSRVFQALKERTSNPLRDDQS